MKFAILTFLQLACGFGIGYQLIRSSKNKSTEKIRFNEPWMFFILFGSYLFYINNLTIFDNYLIGIITAMLMSYVMTIFIQNQNLPKWIYAASLACGMIGITLIVWQVAAGVVNKII